MHRGETTMRNFAEESTTDFVKGPVCRWNILKMLSESCEYVRKQWVSSQTVGESKKAAELLGRACARCLGEKLDES